MDSLPAVPDTVPEFVEWLRAVKHNGKWRKAVLVKLRWQKKRLQAGEQYKPKHDLGMIGRMSEQQIDTLIGKMEQAVYDNRREYMRKYMAERRAAEKVSFC